MKPSELSQILELTTKTRHPVLVKGIPGIGKTEIVEQVAQKTGQELVVMYPVTSEPVDFRGLPIHNKEENKAQFLPFENLEILVNADKPTICLVDDFGQANKNVQAATMHLFQARRIGEHEISDHVTFVVCTNDTNQGAGVTGVLEPVKSRFLTIIELEADFEDWKVWAFQNKINPEIIAFLSMRPELLSKFQATNALTNSPSPRGNKSVSDILDLNIQNKELRFDMIKGAVGEGYAMEFNSFIELFKSIESYDFLIKHPDSIDLNVSDPSILYAYCSMISYMAKPEDMPSIVRFARRLPPEFMVKLIEYDIKTANPRNHETRAYTDWAVENQRILKAA